MLPRSLYVHVPFCARRCSYCDFAVEAVREAPVAEWLTAVEREMRLTAAEFGWDVPLELDTLYVGGGTPSLLGVGAMRSMAERLRPFAVLGERGEWTCEANPESFTPEVARDWRAAGVNRLSLGAQTFDAGALRWMGRLHGADGPATALEVARVAGFEDVSIDLIFGLPGRLARDWAADLERVIEMDPEHVSLYGLTAESGAPLGRWVAEGREALADEDRYADEYLLASRMLGDAGYEHYEVSNFCRPGRESRHNFVYWTGAPYAALGPGAHAYDPPSRRWNVRDWSAYSATLERGSLPLAGRETVAADAGEMERIWLGLRTRRGLEKATLSEGQLQRTDAWERRGLAVTDGGRVRLTPEGWLLLDSLAVDLQETGRPGMGRVGRTAIDATAPLVQIGANSKQ